MNESTAATDPRTVWRKRVHLAYESLLFVFSLYSVWYALRDFSGMPFERWETVVEYVIYAVFVLDYAVFFIIAPKKWPYVYSHVFELLAIIPVYYCTTWLRAFRVLRVINVLVLLARCGRMLNIARSLLNHNGFKYILFTCLALWVLGALGYCYFEGNDTPLPDALWWSIVTMSTVGYGDMSPTSPGARLIAGVLMLVGVGFIGLLSGNLTTYLMLRKQAAQKSLDDELLDCVLNRLTEPEKLSDAEFTQACETLRQVRASRMESEQRQ